MSDRRAVKKKLRFNVGSLNLKFIQLSKRMEISSADTTGQQKGFEYSARDDNEVINISSDD